jgi:hypothetical protein
MKASTIVLIGSAKRAGPKTIHRERKPFFMKVGEKFGAFSAKDPRGTELALSERLEASKTPRGENHVDFKRWIEGQDEGSELRRIECFAGCGLRQNAH